MICFVLIHAQDLNELLAISIFLITDFQTGGDIITNKHAITPSKSKGDTKMRVDRKNELAVQWAGVVSWRGAMHEANEERNGSAPVARVVS